MTFSPPVTLRGDLVSLEPLTLDHVGELQDAVRDGDLWTTWWTRIPAPEAMADDVRHRLGLQDQGSMTPWVVRRQDTGAVCGATTFMAVRPEHRRLEIGSTWLGRSAQRTGINTEAKLLLLAHAFDTLGCVAVELRTHWHNLQSRAAIERLGAKQDGVLRNHDVWPDGTLRDVVVFSVVESEWPTVRANLRYRLTRASAAGERSVSGAADGLGPA